MLIRCCSTLSPPLRLTIGCSSVCGQWYDWRKTLEEDLATKLDQSLVDLHNDLAQQKAEEARAGSHCRRPCGRRRGRCFADAVDVDCADVSRQAADEMELQRIHSTMPPASVAEDAAAAAAEHRDAANELAFKQTEVARTESTQFALHQQAHDRLEPPTTLAAAATVPLTQWNAGCVTAGARR